MLSNRATVWSKIDYAHGKQDAYHPLTNPQGLVNFGNAENWLMHDVLIDFINKNNTFDKSCCAYGEGYTGTTRLRAAMAQHLNTYFNPFEKIDPEELTFAAGVTFLNEACALLTCDEGEAIMLGKPVYGAFYRDMTTRTGVVLEYVDVGDTDQFGPSCAAGFEAGLKDAQERGVRVKALVICNPSNPLGRCYSREALVELLRLCGSKGIHLISDEIYALSVYKRDDRPSETFTSVRSIDYTGLVDPSLVHVLYGMSKDFGAGGLRLGCLVSQNRQFTDALRATCRFASPSQLTMEVCTRLLANQGFVKDFLQRSHIVLRDSRLLAEQLLVHNGISFHDEGNAGLFVWLDLRVFLPLQEAQGDPWKAAQLLTQRLGEAGVIMSTGEAYRSPRPGQFRLVHCMPEPVVREGIKRICRVISL